MIVRVSARGQANGSADGYLCARARAGRLRTRCAPWTRAHLESRYGVLSKLFLEEIEIWEIWEMLHGVLHAEGSSDLEATPCAFTGAEVNGCRVRKPCSSQAKRGGARF